MKKLLFTIGVLLIMVFVGVLFVNATESKKEAKKTKSETIKVEAPAPCSATCNKSGENKTMQCNARVCPEMKCCQDPAKCDPSSCPAHKACEQKDVRACPKSVPCQGPDHCKAGTK